MEYPERARKDLKKLDKEPARWVICALHLIKEDPYHHIKKLKKAHDQHQVYTYRIGFYDRAILSIHGTVPVILVPEIEDRTESSRDV